MSAPLPADTAPPPERGPKRDEPTPRERVMRALEFALFAAWCALVVGLVASAYAAAARGPSGTGWALASDEAYLPLDFARSLARGRPLEWIDGSGHASGDGDVVFSAVVSLGYWAGLRGELVVPLVLGLASASWLVFLVTSAGPLDSLDRVGKFALAPVIGLSGALASTLLEGGKSAFALALANVILGAAVEHARTGRASARRLLGAAGALLVLTRVEGFGPVIAAAVFLAATCTGTRRRAAVVAALAPAFVAWLALGALHRARTGEAWPASFVVRSPWFEPGATFGERALAWWSRAEANATECLAHALPSHRGAALAMLLLAVFPLASRATRAHAALVGGAIAGWLFIAAAAPGGPGAEGRWAHAAGAWIAASSLLGAAVALHALARRMPWLGHPAARGAAFALLAIGLIAARLDDARDGLRAFADGARTVRTRQLAAGATLRAWQVASVIVEQPGAVAWVVDRPALDLSGIGASGRLPFARAARLGEGAVLELVDRLAHDARPEFFAVTPTRWHTLAAVLGRREASFETGAPRGDALELSRADWSSFGGGEIDLPAGISKAERVVDVVDVGDLVSERAHHYTPSRDGVLNVEHRVLPHPRDASRDRFDAGRRVGIGTPESFELAVVAPAGRLVVRSATPARRTVEVRVDGVALGTLELAPKDGWTEGSLALPASLASPVRFELVALDAPFLDCHVWSLGPAG